MEQHSHQNVSDLIGLETYRKVFFSSPEFVSISSLANGKYIDVNPGFERFTGFQRAEVIGKSSLEIGLWLNAEDRATLVNAVEQAGEVHRFPSRLRTRSGVLHEVEVSASLTRSEDGERYLVIVLHDVTERKRNEEELRKYRNKLELLVDERTTELRLANEELRQTNLRLAEAHGLLQETEKRMRHMALHDLLTGLPNRVLLQDRVNQAISRAKRGDKQMALLFIDLDNFKHINDSLGHLIGDKLLQIVATRLEQCVRSSDTVARLGGDEFVICAGNLDNIDHAALLSQKILSALDAPIIVDDHELHVTGSIGISVYPDDGLQVEALLQAADTSMYHAKAKGRNDYSFFTPALNQAVQHRLSIESQLHQALPRNEFLLYYQPQVDIETGRIVSAEALIRWQQTVRGLVPPLEFIPIAEETGLILRIGEWVLREACRQLRCWHEAGHDLSIAVNLSVRQLLQPGFATVVADILRDNHIPASALVLEITESLLMRQSEENLETLHRLTATGIRLSIDDFGTGYSSLSYLKRFPIHELKIDRSFVGGIEHDDNDKAIANTIIAMAKNLDLTVVAEGVETAGQATLLTASRCRMAQGYYYGKPMDAAAFTRLLNSELGEKL